MEKLYIEKLNCLRNETNQIWSGFFITGGGSITLFLSNKGTAGYLLGFLGLILTVSFLNAYFIRRAEIAKILELMRIKK